ncbi:hypothetical protein D9M70_582390 [compost metagenome]
MNLGAAGGQQFRLPGRGIAAARHHDTLGFERPEDRQLGKRGHAHRLAARLNFIPQRQQGIHRRSP